VLWLAIGLAIVAWTAMVMAAFFSGVAREAADRARGDSFAVRRDRLVVESITFRLAAHPNPHIIDDAPPTPREGKG